jgi:PKD repeat protein
VKNLLALLLVFVCLTGNSQNLSSNSHTHFHPDEKPLFKWNTFRDALAQQLNISPEQANSFFSYAKSAGLIDLNDYNSKIEKGIITTDNALHYWLRKIPDYKNLYANNYLPYLAGKKINTSAQRNSTPYSPQSSCNNLDFSSGTTNWQGMWSDIPNPGGSMSYGSMTAVGLNSFGTNDMGYVHEICTPGTDRNVPLSTVPPGHTTSLRLGDDSAYIMNVQQTATGNNVNFPYNHQKISNTFLVTQANKTITYWYAVALSQSVTAPHNQPDQPFFKIRMYDQAGTEIICARYDVDATNASTIGGFQSLIDPTGYNEFLYKDWSQVVIPLLNYVGQNVTITFETCDCALGGHFGYAYLAVDCAPFPGITFVPFVCGMTTTTLTAPPGVATYSWTGPAIVGTHTAQTVTVSAGGTYSVTMTTLGNSGLNCTLMLDTFLQGVPPSPVATFSTLPVCVGNPTVFNGVTPGVYNYVMWNFGDGAKDSSNVTPTHIYAAPGTYTVSLFLDNGCTDTYTAVVTVNPGATSSFNAAPVCRGTPTVFNNTSTGGASYEWNFGDGSTHSTVQSPTHTYANSGNFVVTLTVTNTWGCKFLSTNTVVVNVMPVAQFSAPVACLGQSTTFNNTTTPATNVIYHWDFGVAALTNDTSNIQNPTYTYNTIGTYTVLLEGSTTAGCSSSATHTVTVNPVPSMTLTTPPPYCWNDHVPQTTYTTTPANPAMTFGWTNSNMQIGLGGSGSGIPPAFTAGLNNSTSNISGVITVVPTLNGCTGPPATFTITVKPTPLVSHTSVDYCPNVVTNALTFTATPAASAITWINTTPGVNIGLSTTNGTTTLPSFNAVDPGNSMMSNVISLQAVLNGCTGPLTTFSININPNPVANFTNTPACDGAGTSFTDLSTIGSGTLSSWAWDMNDDGIYTDATIKNPSYILTPVGNHTVNLAITSNKGCMDTV